MNLPLLKLDLFKSNKFCPRTTFKKDRKTNMLRLLKHLFNFIIMANRVTY